MRMLNSALEDGLFEISRIRIRLPRSTKKVEGDAVFAVPRPGPPIQVHHHTEDVVANTAERVDVVDIKTALSIKSS